MKRHQPKFSQSQVVELMQRLYRLTPSEIHSLPSYKDQNFYVAASEGGEYVLKILNSQDSKNPALTDVQMSAMSFLHQNGFPTQTARPTFTGQLISQEEIDCGYGCQTYLVLLLTYLPGNTISKISVTPQLLYEIGKMAAKVDIMLQELEHPHLSVLQRDNYIWNLSNTPLLEAYIDILDGEPLQKVVTSVIHQYQTSVTPKRCNFRKCTIHADLSDLNILVQPDESGGHRISGIIDFGGMNSGYFIYELAISIMFMMLEHQTPIEVGGLVLAGWESVFPLNESEKDCLYVLVLSCFCQSLLLSRYNVSQNPENEEYLMSTSKNGIRIVHQLWELGKEEVEKVWFQTAAQFNDEDKHERRYSGSE
ncbi:LOW QUALITY PROTEIN: hydroxylysine kinase-like [Brachionichthys hirsutus]|uniref:LOW QUALITY PROTEIN: hydroxylysine kinase-like n=1 Tax=Brachionichthys hirsutus TaxID=412623 RepID=UPI0036049638